MSLRFAVVHEAEADFQTATELADRVLTETVDWLDEDLLPHQRDWLFETVGKVRLTWKNLKQLAGEAGIAVRGHFDGKPGEPDARAAQRAILFLRKEFPDLAAVVLVRDRDDQPERRQGLEQARNQNHGGLVIVIGLAVVERECWIISGFDPQDEAEQARLESERNKLGFDPRNRSHDLTACKDDQAKHSPKRVLRELSRGEYDRERRCWRECPLPTLRDRGKENGLTTYLKEVGQRLAGLIGHPA